MKNSKYKVSWKKGILSLIFIIVGLLYYLEIRWIGIGIPCVFNLVTGLECPGCGITGVVLAVLRGDFVTAFRLNMGLWIISPIMIPTIGVCWYRWLTGRNNNVKYITICAIICVVFLLLWTVFRNVYGY